LFIQSELNEYLIKKYLDIIVLRMLMIYPKHGYAILAEIHKNFGVLLSPGLLYPLLYEFEVKGWVETIVDNRKKVYRLTVKGVKKTEQLKSFYMKSFKQLTKFMG